MPRSTRESRFSREAVDFVTGLLTLHPLELEVEKKTVGAND